MNKLAENAVMNKKFTLVPVSSRRKSVGGGVENVPLRLRAKIRRSPPLSHTHALTSKAATEGEREREREGSVCACVWSFRNSRCSRAFLLRDKAISDKGERSLRDHPHLQRTFRKHQLS